VARSELIVHVRPNLRRIRPAEVLIGLFEWQFTKKIGVIRHFYVRVSRLNLRLGVLHKRVSANSLANGPKCIGPLFSMNSQRKRAGESTREMSDRRYKSRVWLIVLIVAATVLLLVLIFNSKALGISGLGLLGLLVLVRLVVDFGDARSSRMMKEERRAIRGARAEEKIGTILDGLGDDYLVLHDISSPYGNIDHLVLTAQGGVFLIETKAHGGRVTVADGRLLVNCHEPEKDFIAQALKTRIG
jgi:hypothetical protein